MTKWKTVQWEFLELRLRNVLQGEVMAGEVGLKSQTAEERWYLHFFPLISRSWGSADGAGNVNVSF